METILQKRWQINRKLKLFFVRHFCIHQKANVYLFKFNNRNSRKRYETCSKLTKIPERRQWRRSDVFIVNFEHILHLFLFKCFCRCTSKCWLRGRFLAMLKWLENCSERPQSCYWSKYKLFWKETVTVEVQSIDLVLMAIFKNDPLLILT